MGKVGGELYITAPLEFDGLLKEINWFIFPSCRSNNLVSCYHLSHIGRSRSLCVMVSSSLSCNEVSKRSLLPHYLLRIPAGLALVKILHNFQDR